jgi:HAD superfamily hydrolase (TIGR01450 family)
MPLSPLLARYDNVILDLDGCVWIGEAPTREAPAAIDALREAGKTLVFLTNDARRAPEDYVRKLWALGIRASLEEVLTVGSAIQFVLAEETRPGGAFVIGAPAIFRHVAQAGQPILNHTERAARAQLVIVAAHDDLTYAELRTATQALLGGAEMISAGRDPTFPDADGFAPGTGAIVAALEYATDARASNVGKPDARIFQAAVDRLPAGDTLVVGDRLDADLAGAAAAGLDAAIVLTGASTREVAEAAVDPAPVVVAEDLSSLVTGR